MTLNIDNHCQRRLRGFVGAIISYVTLLYSQYLYNVKRLWLILNDWET